MNIRRRIKLLLDSKKQIRAVIVFMILVGIVLIAGRLTPFSKVTQTIQSSLYTAGQKGGEAYRRLFSSSDSIQSKLREANKNLAILALDRSYLNQLENEVQELQDLLAYSQSIETKTIPAKILARSQGKEQTILINKGARDGVRQELAVVVLEGHMIGKILEVQERSSTVLLVKDPRSKIAAKILGAVSTLGLVEGSDGFLLKMNFIPQANIIKEGDLVVTSGLDGHIESNLVLGIISQVIKIDTEQFIRAHITPLIDYRTYSNVLIVDPIAEIINDL